MRNFKLNLRWLHGSPNQTGETLTRENRLGIATCLKPLRTLCIPLLLLALGIGQMWAGPTFSGGYAYFYNKGGWNDTYKWLFIGRDKWEDDWTEIRTMTPISNTKLWYNALPSSGWGDATYMRVAGNGSSWDSGKWGSSNYTGLNHRTAAVSLGDWGFGSGNVNMLTPASGSNDATLSLSYVGNSSSSLNLSQTFKVQVSTDGGSTYSDPATSPLTVSFSSYTFSNYTTCGTTSSGSISGTTVSASKDAGYTATTTLTYSSLNSDYDFVCWHDGSSSVGTGTSYTYYPTAVTTITARVKLKQFTVSYGVCSTTRNGSIKLNSGSDVTTTSSSTLNKGTSISFTATPNSGYQVEGWYSDAACSVGNRLQVGGNTYDAGTLTAATTVYVKFEARTGGVITLSANTGGQVSKDNSSWAASATYTSITSTDALNIYAKANAGYSFSAWSRTSGSGTIASTSSANTTFTPVAFTDATVTASFTENKSTITVTTATSSQGTLKFGSTSKSWGATASVGVATEQSITATAAAGFTFVRWDLSGAAASESSLTSATITLKADGSGNTGTATAVFEEDLTSPWIVAGGNNIVTSGTTWRTTADANNMMTKKTGASTENVVYFTIPITTTCTGDNNTNFQFKIYNTSTSKWYAYDSGENSYYLLKAEDGTQKNLNEGGRNIELRAYIAGNYELKLDYSTSTPKLTVTWPEINQVRISAANPTDATNTGNYDLGEAVSNVRSVTRSLNANTTYTFKVVYASDWYGKNSGALTRSTSTSSNTLSELSTSGGDMTLTTDYAGSYTFKFNQSSKVLSVDFPAAYKVTYGKGSVNGSSSNCSAVDLDNSSSTVTSNTTWVLSGHRVKLTAPAAKTGYTFDGWFDNNSGTGDAITTNANCTITVTSAQTLYACYHLNNHAITHSASTHGSYTIQVGSAAAVSTNTTSDYGKTITLAATPATGYSFGSWSVYKTGTPATTVTVTNNTFTMPDYPVTVSATFSPINYTITYNTNGGSAIAAGNYTIETATFSLPTTSTKTGYTFAGWYDNEDLTGDPVPSIASGSYGNKTYWAKWTPNEYTVSFNVNGGTASTPSNKEVTYGAAYGELPGGMTHTSKQFIGWYTDPDDGEGTHITAETIVSTAENHTLYAHYENVYSVNVNFKCGSDVIYPATSVDASPTSLAPTITAPEIFGYSFVNWTGTNVTFADPSSATTTITATVATSVTANYSVVPTVYFKNNLGWENVYVTFDCYWKEAGGKQVPGNNGKPYYKMTQIGSSDVYYCVIPAGCVSSWKWNIAFDNKGYGYNEETHIGTYDPFYEGEFTGRGDFDPKATMFIPYNGDTETRNSGTFYKSGCWMKYNSTESGYQVKMNEYVTGAHVELSTTNLTAPTAGGYEFSAIVNLPKANYSYGFKLYKEYQENDNDLWYTNTGGITSATDNLPWPFWSGSDIDANSQRCGLHTEALGDYKITVSFATGKPMVSVEYPVSTGDWKLIYKDLATWSNGAHTAAWQHPSRVIKAKADAEDIVSFYVAHGSSPSIELYKCTAIDAGTGAETWTKQSDVSLTGISKKGVYNFKVSQNESKDATVTLDGEYTGNYYIRTDASDGGWTNYTNGVNTMTYSEYSIENGGFTHYFMAYRSAGTNVKFTIANDYSTCISDTLEGDTYTAEYLDANANIRFMWDKRNNVISRAYLSGSSIVSDRFLVLEGDAKMFDESGNELTTAGGGKISGLNDYEMKFTDDQNWVYEATVQANPNARIKLTANFNGKIQYFYGAEGDRSDETTYQLIGGTGSGKWKVRVVYDFKTNRLVCAWMPTDEPIEASTPINADVMIIRYHQGNAQQITFSNDGELTDVKTVYGAMEFNKYRLNNQNETGGHGNLGLSQYERDLFFISFPFDVKLNDVFGFGTYGKHWIIEYYDGKTRAKEGFWADSPSNWKFVTKQMKDTFTLKANEGYVLALDLDELTMSSSVWNYGVENIYLYFPSEATLENIQATNKRVKIDDQTDYYCSINRPYGTDGDRRVKDSYWHLLGVPSFANANHATGSSWVSNTYPNQDPATWTSSAPYVYEWSASANTFSVVSSSSMTFKPMYSYLAQYAKDTIIWTQVNTPVASPVAARRAKAQETCEFQLALMQNDNEEDHTFISLRDDENVTEGFDFNYDLSKILYGSFSSANAIYTFSGTEQVAGNALPMSDKTTVVPVGVQIATAGEYTFAMPEGTNGTGVVLVDTENGTRTNLALGDYTVTLGAGTTDGRFVLEISPVANTPTGIDEVPSDQVPSTNVRKVMVDGVLYIVKDGKAYDARGTRVE